MNPARIWTAQVRVDTSLALDIKAPLVIVIEALSRTLASIDPLLVQSSIVKIKLSPW